jgi:hypothetical protein
MRLKRLPSTGRVSADGAAIARSSQDAEAFAEVFDRHFAFVHRYIARVHRQACQLDDLPTVEDRRQRARISDRTVEGGALRSDAQLCVDGSGDYFDADQLVGVELTRRLVSENRVERSDRDLELVE